MNKWCVVGMLTPISCFVVQAQEVGISITNIEILKTDGGLQMVLQTSKTPTAPIVRSQGLLTFVDIPKAVLNFPEGTSKRQENPFPGIAYLEVRQEVNNFVRLIVAGTEKPPVISLSNSPQGIAFSVSPVIAQVSNEEIELTVTGTQDSYNASQGRAATRIDVPLRDIPRSVQVVPAEVIKDQQAITLDDVLRNVSGVAQGNTFGGTADGFEIRGFSADIFRNGQPDVPGTSAFSSVRSTTNLDRVEVLKGPAAILYGSLSPGGVINLVTKKPLSQPFYAVGLAAGNFGFYQPSIDLSGPLNQDGSVKYRLNASYQNSSSFRDFTNIQQTFIAPVISWESDRTKITFDFQYLNDRRPFDRGLVAFGEGVADIPIERRLGEPGDFREVKDLSLGYQLEHQVSDSWTLRNTFRALLSENNTARFEPRFLDEETGELSREFRITNGNRQSYALRTEGVGKFATGSIQHQALVGIDLNRVIFDETGFRRRPVAPINIFAPVFGTPIPDAPLSFITANQTDSVGLYLQDLISLTDNLKLLVGGRFDFIDQKRNDPLAEDEVGQRDNAFSPSIGLVYQPSKEISIYGSFSQSFQPNGAIRSDGNFLEPERGNQYEVGLRGEFFEGKLTSNLAFFNLTRTNVGITDPNDPDFSIPVGEQRSQGIELDVAGEILPGWKVIANYALTDAVISQGDEFTPTGNLFPNVPRNSASLWTTYTLQSGNLQGLGFGVGVFFVDERTGDTENTFNLPAYTRTDASLYYRRDNWRAALNVQNLFNVRYFASSGFGRERITPGDPFTIVGSLTWEF